MRWRYLLIPIIAVGLIAGLPTAAGDDQWDGCLYVWSSDEAGKDA